MTKYRYRPVPMKLTGHPGIDAQKIAEQRDFYKRMRDGERAMKAAKQWRKDEAKRARKVAKKGPAHRGGTPRFRIAAAFRPGHGELS